MKIFLDTEFYEDGHTIELISIGLVRDDEKEYYAETPGAKDICMKSEWLKKNVMPHLTGKIIPKDKIKSDIVEFVGEKPEFWGYYADYDWVVLCQLFGTMMDLPKGWPMFCMDVKQLAVMKGSTITPHQFGDEHHALYDARHNKLCYEWLQQYEFLK